MKTLALFAFMALLGAAPAFADAPAPATSTAKQNKIRLLLKVTKADQIGMSMLAGMKAQLPPAQYEQVAKVIKPDEMVEMVVGVYDRHFTEKDIDGLLAFYATPLGKRLIQEGPEVAKESMILGQQYAIQKLSALRNAAPPSPPAP